MTVLAALLIALLTVLSSCSKDDPVEPPPPPDPVNPNQPNSNAAIVSQQVFGETALKSRVNTMEPVVTGGYFFGGEHNSRVGIGRLDRTGVLEWFTRTDFEVRDIFVFGDNLIVVGALDIDDDGESERGYVGVYDGDGLPVDVIEYTGGGADVWFNAVAPVTDRTLVAAGGRRANGERVPFVALVSVDIDGFLQQVTEAAISGVDGVIFDNVAAHPSLALTFFATGDNAPPDLETENISVHRVAIHVGRPFTFSVEWSADIIAFPGLSTLTGTGDRLVVDGSHVYVVGHTNEIKGKLGNTDLWDSGLAARLTTEGDVDWVTSVSLSQQSEHLFGAHLDGGRLYAVGEFAAFVTSGRLLSYGLLCEIDAETGALGKGMSFGSKTYGSEFSAVDKVGGAVICGGSTKQVQADGGRQLWFAEIDPDKVPGEESLGVARALASAAVTPPPDSYDEE